MKKQIFPAVMLSILCLILCCVVYTGIVYGIAKISPDKGNGQTIAAANGKYYYANIAQSFTQDKYFWPRPSAVAYNAAGSGGSNKGPANPEYLATVQSRIDSFMKHNPGVRREDVPSELVTASGSGLDPDISEQAAMVQVARVAQARNIDPQKIAALIKQQVQQPTLGMFGPEKVNVLQLNIVLDKTHF
jgi:potassium-transporting ATPase KdpC subunit